MAKVVIVTPTHNRSDLLRETLDSVQRQTFTDWEQWVCDDASQDDTPAVMQERMASEPRLRYHRFDASVGACRARNHGWKQSDAPYVMFLDSDDLIHPEKLARQVEFLDANLEFDAHVVQMSHFGEKPGDDPFLWNTFAGSDWRLRFLGHEPVFGIHAPLWRRSLIERLSGFDESLPMAQDYDLHARAGILGAKIQLDPALMCYCRRHDGASIGRDKTIRRMSVLDKEFDALEALLRQENALGEVEMKALCGNRLWVSQIAFYQKDVPLALSVLEKATISNSAKRKFAALGRILAKVTRHRLYVMMREIASSHGHDLSTRETWLHSQRIDAEPGMPTPDFRA